MKKIICLIALLPSFSYLVAEMKIDFTAGDVILQKKGGPAVKAVQNQKVNSGDVIRTGEKSVAVISFSDNRLTVRQKSHVVISETIEDGVKKGTLSVLVGNVNCKMDKLRKQGGQFNVDTASSTAGVRGTEFNVASGADGTSVLEVSEGIVEYSGNTSSVMVEANQESSVSLGGDPSPVKVLKRRDWDKWASENSDVPRGKEKEILEGCLSRAKKLDSDITALEAEKEKYSAEGVEYEKIALQAKADRNESKLKEYSKKMFDSKRYAHSAFRKSLYQAEKIAMVKFVAENVYLSSGKKGNLKKLLGEIGLIYDKNYDKYIKPVEKNYNFIK